MTAAQLAAPPVNSHVETRERFGTADAAARYPADYHDTWKDRAERDAILAALADVPAGARVLDLPCGTGRLTELLWSRGFAVTGADSSPHMVSRAREHHSHSALASGSGARPAEFSVRDAMQTGFTAGEFHAVICNRLFHHFSEPAVRQQVLRELSRICRGPLVVSFFNTFALDSLRFRLKWLLRRRQPVDRIPISLAEFTADGQAAGLKLERAIPTRWGISPMWYAVFRKAA